ncbi:tetratricopeptide repeat protein [Donghicola mangrovi]|uniref:Sel1 repeat family protein n=1 Tax=Donghicola mangrovi TaxID=2729614 RepID=A0A850Q8Q0_9RHOB|nr:sel1 repeat family protein [Donghicola mangrovi]NVO22699.1 sel1 repeat family protein [Donghicola mangrovi]
MHFTLAFVAAILAAPVMAAEYGPEDGTLNPEELTWRNNVRKAEEGKVDMIVCASGYLMTKSGDHDSARKIFKACADAGYTAAMTWMSYMENNGFGGEYDPDAAAQWDQRAAELGDPVGKFNHGVNLLRGYGIAQNAELGRKYVDEAANEGLQIARRLQGADYNLDEVTPDADNWRYAPLF